MVYWMDNLVLDASASTDVGDNILLETSDGIDLEDGFQITSDAILFEANTKTVSDVEQMLVVEE